MKIYKPQAITEIGKRQNQEDAIFPSLGNATTEDRLFLVCDGMGGHESGEVASNSVCQSISTFLKGSHPDTFSSDDFRDALIYAYNQLDKIDSVSPNSQKKMGTTLTFLYLGNKQAFIAHIGDSRIYQLRPNGNGTIDIIHKTNDHSWINLLLRNGDITEEEAKNHPLKNNITRAIQPNLEERCKATLFETRNVKDGDYFFLCSDGVLESIDDNLLQSILASDDTDENKLNKIKEICRTNSRDNHSAYLIHIEEGLNTSISDEENQAESHSAEIDPNILEAEDANKIEGSNQNGFIRNQNISSFNQPKNNVIGAINKPKGGGKPSSMRPFHKGLFIGLGATIILLIGGIILYFNYFAEENKKGNHEITNSTTTTTEDKKDSTSEEDKQEKTSSKKITIEIKNENTKKTHKNNSNNRSKERDITPPNKKKTKPSRLNKAPSPNRKANESKAINLDLPGLVNSENEKKPEKSNK